MAKIASSLVITILNEESSISQLLDSICHQSLIPNEIVLVDGGSKDQTTQIIRKHKIYKRHNVRLFVKHGNIPVGRNFGIKFAKGKLIAITDAGCVLDKDWFKYIISPFKDKSVDIVAGYYKGKPENNFQKSTVPYVLIMPDKLDIKSFLPATRSMAIRRTAWESAGKFREDLNYAEDFEFAKRAARKGLKTCFQRDAIVYWTPRENIISAFRMFFNYAAGDVKAGIYRLKVILIFMRYTFAILSLFLIGFLRFGIEIYVILLYFSLYTYWAVSKNYKYVRHKSAFIYLPLLQFVSDLAVILGTITSIINKALGRK